jgi:hypothetical protein
MALPIYDNIPELSPQAAAIARRRKIAEAMLAQSQEQTPSNQMAGQVVAPVSWTQGLAKLAQAYVGNKQAADADKAEQGLANKRQQMVADALAKINQTAQGSAGVEGVEAQPERTIQAPSPMQQGQVAPNYNTVPETVPAVAGREAVPAVAPNKRQAVMEAIMSNLPELQKYGAAMQGFEEMDIKNAQLDETRLANIEQKKLDRDARMEGIKAQIESREAMGQQTNDLRAAMANLQAETRRDIAEQSSADRRFIAGENSKDRRAAASGKAEVKDEAKENAKLGLASSLDAIDAAYKKLDKMGGIVNPKKGSFSNLKARAASSAVGQMTGGAFGTEEQALRDEIKGTIPLLVLDIKNATGASAQQMNSNVELQNFMRAASDPTSNIESNLKLIDNLRKKFVDVGEKSPEKVIEVDW